LTKDRMTTARESFNCMQPENVSFRPKWF